MSLLALVVLVLLALTVPQVSPSWLAIDAHAPDVWVLAALYLALRARGFAAVPWAILLGLVRDAVSLDPLGTHAFVLGVVALGFSEGRSHRGRLDGMPRLLFTALGVVVAGVTYRLRLLPLAGSGVTLASFVDVLPTALWTTLLAAGLFPLLDQGGWLDDLCGRRRGLPA